MLKYIVSYSSSIVTLVNIITIFWIIRLISSSSSNEEQLAELIFLVGLFPVIALGYPTSVIAEVSRSRKLDRLLVHSAYQYMGASFAIVFTISYTFFTEVWWVCSAYPLVFVVSLIRGYFEAFENFWLSAIFKLLVSSVLLTSASQFVIHELSANIFSVVCVSFSVILMVGFYRISVNTAKKSFKVTRYSVQTIVVLSFIFMDRSLMKFTAESNAYVDFILTQEVLYKIVSMFMLISVFHFPELNSDNKFTRRKGKNAYKLQLLFAFCSILLFVLTPVNKVLFEILGLTVVNINFLMIPALFLPVMSILLQKFALSELSDGLVRIFLYTVAWSSVVGVTVTYILQDPVYSMASRGAIEAVILMYFIRKETNGKRLNS